MDQEIALLIGTAIGPKEDRDEAEASMLELAELAESADVRVAGSMIQQRPAADARWLIGKGKVLELRMRMEQEGANVAIFDTELSPAQVRNLEEALGCKIIDRTQLILDIFAQRAKTREGKLQVELAQLNYLLPRLSGHGVHLSRLGGGIGTRGPGETKLETDRRHIQRRVRDLKQQLRELERHRSLHRARRRKNGVFQVSLVGYTNAGKSTLLRALTGADAYVENRLFATLDPTTRTMRLPSGKEVLLTDTVGFIRNLPHDLVAAFRSTLEEVCEADLILHVVDGSDPERGRRIEVVDNVLEELGAGSKEQLLVYNKRDLAEVRTELLAPPGHALSVSALDSGDMQQLKERIEQLLQGETIALSIPAADGRALADAYRIGEVISRHEDGEHIHVQVRVNARDYEQQAYRIMPYLISSDIQQEEPRT
ncbi:GTPase HflX [Xylanibacillus composti]|uniref:GTPase HflX n=1 Tax=Xylanibacillus composti TaxID=1572762 RepID=A0A8J4H5L5_9BACL|nr:GTPase HflX [Xylanibacillus composti]MDT9724283.1 GTPase HflX [Xylanibacillus composti]GIQ69279.1 GTPase HflX [Xylanibacillus composti]